MPQYQNYNGVFIRSFGEASSKLDSGFYSVESTSIGPGFKKKNIINDDLIDIPGTVADDIFKDIEIFMKSSSRYSNYGLTHKRGYLLYGPPGSGKTSLSLMIAKKFVNACNGVVFYISSSADLLSAVGLISTIEPGRPSLYLLEEADEFLNSSSCLSILDGELSITSSIFVAMTNYKGNLPPRIANRPGRFDRVVHVTCPDEKIQLEYLTRIESREQSGPTVAKKIVKALSGLPVSMSHLREAFISHVLMGFSLKSVRERFEEMCSSRIENDEDDSESDYDDDDKYYRDEHDKTMEALESLKK